MTLLSVNVNKIATLRNARGNDLPNLKQVTKDLLNFGAQGITVHPRPDERHITRKDVYELKPLIADFNKSHNTHIEFNVEGFPSPEFMDLMQDIRPEQVTLVPDPPDVITSNAGWDCEHNREFLIPIVETLKKWGCRVSLFVDPVDVTENFVSAIGDIGCERAELYTEKFALQFAAGEKDSAVAPYIAAAELLNRGNIQLNAGHDLNLQNVRFLIRKVPKIKEVSIGHALVCEALYLGLQQTVKNYLEELRIHEH
ncbi:MAG: pyridoxine 5'-phosphate synthase [Bdellovibrionales bacterium]